MRYFFIVSILPNNYDSAWNILLILVGDSSRTYFMISYMVIILKANNTFFYNFISAHQTNVFIGFGKITLYADYFFFISVHSMKFSYICLRNCCLSVFLIVFLVHWRTCFAIDFVQLNNLIVLQFVNSFHIWYRNSMESG